MGQGAALRAGSCSHRAAEVTLLISIFLFLLACARLVLLVTMLITQFPFPLSAAVACAQLVFLVTTSWQNFSGPFEFFTRLDDKFQSQGKGIAKLMLHCLGAEVFRFWQDGKLLSDDVTQRVDDPWARTQTRWSWRTSLVVDGS